MTGFDSDAAAYIVGILVGAIVAIAAVGGVGVVLYRRLGIAALDNDEELTNLRRQASLYESPTQDTPNVVAELH